MERGERELFVSRILDVLKMPTTNHLRIRSYLMRELRNSKFRKNRTGQSIVLGARMGSYFQLPRKVTTFAKKILDSFLGRMSGRLRLNFMGPTQNGNWLEK